MKAVGPSAHLTPTVHRAGLVLEISALIHALAHAARTPSVKWSITCLPAVAWLAILEIRSDFAPWSSTNQHVSVGDRIQQNVFIFNMLATLCNF